MSEHGNPQREMGNPAAAPSAAADCDETVPLAVHVQPFGPDQARIDRSIAALLEHPRVRDMVAVGDHRLLSFNLEQEGDRADCANHGEKHLEGCFPDRFAATIYEAMGIDPATELHDRLGRPIALCTGRPIAPVSSGASV